LYGVSKNHAVTLLVMNDFLECQMNQRVAAYAACQCRFLGIAAILIPTCPEIKKTGGVIMISHKISGLTVLAAGLLLAGTPAFAGDYASDSSAKFARGLANTTTGWGEIPKNIANESHERNAFVGATYGTVKGTAHTLGRTAVGAFDLVTFFVPSGEYVHSTYVWENTGRETTYGQ